jgi:molecular chaperone DnaK (HSP70)
MVEQHGQTCVAIDFGTTTSFVARRPGAGPATIVPLSPSTPFMLSVVAYAGGRRVVGDEDNFTPDQLVRSVKRAITERVQNVPVGSGGSLIDADEAMAAIFAEIRRRSNGVLAQGEVRLGCPAMWDSGQRRRLIGIARRAGLKITDATLIDEPVAAGLAWLADHDLRDPEPITGRVLVFDMGGGTLDVAVLDISGPPAKEISVLASRGNPLAGDRLDESVTADLIIAVELAGVDFGALRQPAQAKALIGRMAREAKIALSTQDVFTLVLPPAVFGRLIEIDYTRPQVEMAFQPLMAQAEKLVEEALVEAQMKERFSEGAPQRGTANDIDYVLLIGGMSQIPYLRQRLAARFADAEFVAPQQADPVEAVVKGLTDNTGYERINLHRPAFDFVLEWDGGAQRRLLYEAYTPLYHEWKPSAGRARLNYERRGRTMRLPREGRGHLRVISPSGRPVRLTIDGQSIDRLPVRFGFQELVFKLYSDGQVVVTDGVGKQTAMRVDRWPVIASRDPSLQLKKVKRKPMDAPPVWFVGAAE